MEEMKGVTSVSWGAVCEEWVPRGLSASNLGHSRMTQMQGVVASRRSSGTLDEMAGGTLGPRAERAGPQASSGRPGAEGLSRNVTRALWWGTGAASCVGAACSVGELFHGPGAIASSLATLLHSVPKRLQGGSLVTLALIVALVASAVRDSRRPMEGGRLVSPLTPRLGAVASAIFVLVCLHQVPSTCRLVLSEMWDDSHAVVNMGALAAAAVMNTSVMGSPPSQQADAERRPPLWEKKSGAPSPPNQTRGEASSVGANATVTTKALAASSTANGVSAGCKGVKRELDICVGCDKARLIAVSSGLSESW